MNCMFSLNRSRLSRAFTLVELLVALAIATVLTAVALPSVKEALKQNIVARSAAVVKGAFLNARAQAVRTGRPFGVVIERQRDTIGDGAPAQLNFFNASYSTRLYYVQTPLIYRGDVEKASAYLFRSQVDGALRFFIAQSSANILYAAALQSNGADRILSAGTRFSVGRSGRIFEIVQLTPTTLAAHFGGNVPDWALDSIGNPARGTVIDFNERDFYPTHARPGGLQQEVAYPFEIVSNPTRAPLMPVALVGKTAIDLSISGPADDPALFGGQTQFSIDPNAPPTELEPNQFWGPVTVMFAPDGQLDAIYTSVLVRPPVGYTPTYNNPFVVQRVRLNPTTAVSFNVGYIDGVLANLDDGARYPDHYAGTMFPSRVVDAPLATPLPPDPLIPTKVPNFANADCAWVTIQPLNGAVTLDTIAAQPPLNELGSYYGLGNTPLARAVMNARLHQARRLTTAGVVQ